MDGTHPTGILSYYQLQRSCGQGNIFTPVCHSFCSQWGGVCLSTCWDTPQSGQPPGADTSREQTPPGSRHPPEVDTPQKQTAPGSRPPPPEQTYGLERPVRILLECILVCNSFTETSPRPQLHCVVISSNLL